ncbi:hypothetical protein DK871_26260 [Pseudomonas sp. L13]|nr:hypothetical protein [Pseudomonas sp. L13]
MLALRVSLGISVLKIERQQTDGECRMLDEWWFVFERYECDKQHFFDYQHTQAPETQKPRFREAFV